MDRRYSVIIIIASCVALHGCSGSLDDMGFSKSVPDEFRVVSSPPLAIPDTFSLPKPVNASKKQSARQVTASSLPSDRMATLTKADDTFLSRFGTKHDTIREIIDTEYHDYISSLHTKIQQKLGLTTVIESPFTTSVDATAEKQRLDSLSQTKGAE